MGDINVNFIKKECHENIKNILQLNGFTQIINEATPITEHSKTLIDVIAANKPYNIRESIVVPAAYSDHDMVGCCRKINHIKFTPKTTTARNYTHYDHNAMANDLRSINWDPVVKSNDVEQALTIFNDLLSEIFDRHAP